MIEKQRKVETLTGSNIQKAEKIFNYLVCTPEGATPKMIALNTSLNVNTVKTILPKLENVKRFTRGWYKVVNKGDTPILHTWTFHNLVMTVNLPNESRSPSHHDYDLGLIKATLDISRTAKATLRVACDTPLNVSSICMVYGFLRETLKNIMGYSPSLQETLITTIEFNKDYKNLRLDGVKAITLDNLITHFKLYQKQLILRKEHKTKHQFNTQNLIDMLTQNPNELELATRIEEQEKKLDKLIKITTLNYNMTKKNIGERII